MVTAGGRLARFAYGLTFVVGVPVLLVVWARQAAPHVPLPPVGGATLGLPVMIGGAALLVAGMAGLARHGRGLPMNAFPPPRFVRQGIYGWVRDPIYLGFGLLVLGVASTANSAAGFWLVSPVTWLAMAALVFGYERHDLERRFPGEARQPTRLSLPARGAEAPEPGERLATLLWVFGPWLLCYYAVQALGPPPDAFSTRLPFEADWPVIQWSEAVYVSAYLFVPLTVLVARTRTALREFAVGGLVATVMVTLLWIAVPVVAAHRPFEPTGWWGTLLAFEQGSSAGVAAFPAFHVLWPMLAARAWAAERSAAAGAAAWAWAGLIALSCLATGHHGIVDVAAGALMYVPTGNPRASWAVVRGAGEAVANSWREWRVGPVRFMNHGLYAGAAGVTGILVAGSVAGPGMETAVAWVAAWAMVGAGMYAQVLEGSSRLLRPFGWYGGLIGGVVGVLTSPLVGGTVLTLAVAYALASPWVQAVGRMRCLVQGCCHGAPTTAAVGLRYRHPRSRVCHIAEWAGVPLFPTPVLSMAGNVVIGVLLIRLRTLGAADLLLVGLYFILTGIARFVEESYRGEPQTPRVAGLRIYQWFAVGTLLVGILLTMLPGNSAAGGIGMPTARLLAWAAVFFVLAATAMGLDFPGSDRRFSRLASTDRRP